MDYTISLIELTSPRARAATSANGSADPVRKSPIASLMAPKPPAPHFHHLWWPPGPRGTPQQPWPFQRGKYIASYKDGLSEASDRRGRAICIVAVIDSRSYSEKMSIRFIDREEVARRLTYDLCIPIVREAMIALSRGETKQLLRSILPLSEGRLFGVMPGALGAHAPFGAKLITVFHGNSKPGNQSHQGLVVLFDPQSGAPICIVHAGEITAIRTAAASAVATAVLARPDARRLAIIGCGVQAATHARAISKVRRLTSVAVWGRSPDRVRAFAERMQAELAIPIAPAADVEEAAAQADIICTVTAATEPVLKGVWVRPGTHLNLVGSGYAGPTEVDNDLVVRSRFIADSREGILRQGAEFLRAKEAGLIGDHHIVAEIGQVLAGEIEGRRNHDDITVYKSIGHVVQDLASAWALYSRPEASSKR
jgi:ornithine cyclodeaminase/alanine dehydrogenase-like protein (mu-crystallin family)